MAFFGVSFLMCALLSVRHGGQRPNDFQTDDPSLDAGHLAPLDSAARRHRSGLSFRAIA
jgi:hypothetical protein